MREEPEVSFESIYSKHSEYGIKDQLIIADTKKTWTASLYQIFCCCCFF